MIHQAKKSLGQNFLKSDAVLRKIVEAGEVTKEDVILEIGPGKGALTEKLLEVARLVIAVEKDRELYEFLKIKFAKEIETRTLILVYEDILNFNPSAYGLKPSIYKIIANIPYNITGAILRMFLTAQKQPKMMVLMVQHEVATRILAKDGKESLLSISVKAYGTPKLVIKVDKRYFSPAPKVNSAVIKINDINREVFTKNGRVSMDGTQHDSAESEEKFWKTVKSGFAHKRKKLSGNLKGIISRDARQDVLILGLLEKRAEDLTMENWLVLSQAVI